LLEVNATISINNIGVLGADRIGGATVVPKKIEELQSLLQRANEALYLAKHGGRNRVVMAASE